MIRQSVFVNYIRMGGFKLILNFFFVLFCFVLFAELVYTFGMYSAVTTVA